MKEGILEIFHYRGSYSNSWKYTTYSCKQYVSFSTQASKRYDPSFRYYDKTYVCRLKGVRIFEISSFFILYRKVILIKGKNHEYLFN